MKKWVKGNPNIQATYDGKTYYFPGSEQKEMFLVDPAKYVPALGGDCTVCLANMRKRVPGTVRHAALANGRLFLFPGGEQKQEFFANQAKYADIDLALGGKCAVCRVEINKDVPGNPEIAEYHQGFRYLFPSEKQREMFRANPAKYAVKHAADRQHASASEPVRRRSSS
jgi:YHS domain-containing protein